MGAVSFCQTRPYAALVAALSALCHLGVVAAAAGAPAADGRPAQPNVVLIYTDDLGWQDVACYDVDDPTPFETPHLDRLASQGTMFWQAYSPTPVCSPSRGAVLAGQHAARLGRTSVLGGHPPVPYSLENWRVIPPYIRGRLRIEEFTLAEALRDAGYATGHAGKWHVAINHAAYPQPEDHGFGYTKSHLGVTRRMEPDRVTGFATDDPKDQYRLDENGYAFHQNSEDALDFVKGNKDKPFFLYYATWLVHSPIHTRNEALLRKYSDKLGIPFPQDPGKWEAPGQANPFYAAMVDELDYYVGQLIKYLDETDDPRWPGHKLAENTYIVFTSDNGGYLKGRSGHITSNAPLRGGKIRALEGGIRVPLIVRGPSVPAGIQSHAVVNGIDFYPTILSWTGTPRPAGQRLDGVDLAPMLAAGLDDPNLMRDEQGRVREHMVWHFPHSVSMRSAVRKGDYKLIRNWDHVGRPDRNEYELYRLYDSSGDTPKRVDIEESQDLAASMPEKTRELASLLEAELTDMNAGRPHLNPHFKGGLPHQETVPAVVDHGRDGREVWVAFETRGADVTQAVLYFTDNGGQRYEEWYPLPAQLSSEGRATATLPENATHYVLTLLDENNFLVSCPEMGDVKTRNANGREKYSVKALAVE